MSPSTLPVYAVAAGPYSGTPITTDTIGIDARIVTLSAHDGVALPAYVAQPITVGATTAGSAPIILVVQEIFGLHAYIPDVCRRLAKLGYLAIAPDLFYRHGDPIHAPDFTVLRAMAAEASDAQVMADLDTALDWAAHNGGDIARAGITGFCWGGRTVWLYAAHSSRIKAAVAWYGRVEGDKTLRQPFFPIDLVEQLKAPVLGLYGEADQAIPLDGVKRMQAALASVKALSSITVYDNAPHGFHSDYRTTYQRDAAEHGWNAMIEWFSKKGVKV